jgi:2,3-bisphosphoglycerate-dependent phosphoglycerate mutase
LSRLYLIKHSLPEKRPERPSKEWVLGAEGRALAKRLGERLAGAGIARVVTSTEPKAHDTGLVMAGALGDVPVSVADGLHEQERVTAPFCATEAEYVAAIVQLFARPGERVFGEESADEAHARFAAALGRVVAESDAPLAVVSHGTVMSLFIARHNRLDVFPLWKSLGLPSCAVLSLPELAMLDLVEPAPAPR